MKLQQLFRCGSTSVSTSAESRVNESMVEPFGVDERSWSVRLASIRHRTQAALWGLICVWTGSGLAAN